MQLAVGGGSPGVGVLKGGLVGNGPRIAVGGMGVAVGGIGVGV